MARGPEGKVQDAVLRYAKSKGLIYKKNEVGRFFVSSGWPDVAIYPGNGGVFFIEFKAPGAKPTPLQAHVHSQLRTRGYLVYVVDEKQAGCAIINKHCDVDWKRS